METYAGFWYAEWFFIAFIILFFIARVIKSLGDKKYKSGVHEDIFLSGHREKEYSNYIGSENLYWGFKESLRRYYSLMKKMHNGIISEYIFWFYISIIVVLALIVFGVI